MMYDSPAVLDAGPSDGVDPDEFVRAAVRWHFDPETGSRYWLDRAERLAFDPRRDVKGVDDLALFPDLSDELRQVPVADLIPGVTAAAPGCSTSSTAAGRPGRPSGSSSSTTGCGTARHRSTGGCGSTGCPSVPSG